MNDHVIPIANRYASEIRRVVRSALRNRELAPDHDVHRVSNVVEFEYTPTGIGGITIESSVRSTETWDNAILSFWRDRPSTPHRDELLAAVKSDLAARRSRKSSHDDAAYVSASYLCRLVTLAAIDGRPTASALKVFARHYQDLRDGLRRPCPVSYHLFGIYVPETSFTLGCSIGKVLIRRPRNEDLSTRLDSPSIVFTEGYASAVLETKSSLSAPHLAAEAKRLRWTLQFFRPGAVGNGDIATIVRNVGPGPQLMWASGTGPSNSKLFLYLREEDIPHLRRFVKYVNSQIPESIIVRDDSKSDPIKFAARLYETAIHGTGLWEKQVADAVVGLEALLMDDNVELTYRLGNRCSKLMELVGKDALKVRDDLKLAYSVRSTYLHGGRVSPKKVTAKWANLSHFCYEIIDILRLCLLSCILTGLEKKRMALLLDDALLSKGAEKQLVDLFRPVQPYLIPTPVGISPTSHLTWSEEIPMENVGNNDPG